MPTLKRLTGSPASHRRSSAPVLGLVALLVALGLTGQVRAQRIVYVDADATGANDGTNWQDAYVDLQDGLADAARTAAESPVEIWVAEGVYRPDRGTGDRTMSFS